MKLSTCMVIIPPKGSYFQVILVYSCSLASTKVFFLSAILHAYSLFYCWILWLCKCTVPGSHKIAVKEAGQETSVSWYSEVGSDT